MTLARTLLELIVISIICCQSRVNIKTFIQGRGLRAACVEEIISSQDKLIKKTRLPSP